MFEPKIRNTQTDLLMKAVLTLQNTEDAYRFFEDLCTIREVRDLGQRLEVARLLDGGSSYQRAGEATGASSATIGRVKRCLNYGSGGYGLILVKMN